MKIALINENSQAAKNALIEATLRKVVEPMGHEVVNYGMYAADDAAQLTYVQNGILAAVLLNAGFIAYAFRLWRQYSDALARKTFRFSIIHMSLLFAALLVDHYV